jgi:hypothetical protein
MVLGEKLIGHHLKTQSERMIQNNSYQINGLGHFELVKTASESPLLLKRFHLWHPLSLSQ